jgi:enoyl-CoA hydratase/carnithine racemase
LSDAPRITTERREAVFLIGLSRAAKMNALDLRMLRELAAAYTEYEEDDALRCAVVFADGKHFTAGLDLADVGPAMARGEATWPDDAVNPWGTNGRRRTKPVVCAVQGRCLTAGIELMLASDIRLAAEGAAFGQIEVLRGIFPFGGATIRWPALTGWGNAMRYLLTGDTLDAQEALRIGMVCEVLPPEQLLERAVELAGRVAQAAPLGVRATLRSAWKAEREGVEAAYADLTPTMQSLFASADAREGMMSFTERRTAQFTGE